MCKLMLSAIACLLFMPHFTQAQGKQRSSDLSPVTSVDRLCPTIVVGCPTELVPTLSAVTFTAQISGASPDSQMTFTWSVSGGTIIGGQGTRIIKVDTDGLGAQQLTATIEVGGLDAACTRTASCSRSIAIADIFPFDEFTSISLNDEKARLDNFAFSLQQMKNGVGYLVIYGGRRAWAGEVQRRGERAKDYLIKRRQIAAKRIVIINGGYREEATTELWIIPEGFAPPTGSPTVAPTEVVIINPHKRRRKF